MSADSSIEKENPSTKNLLEDAVKDKLFNKVFAYIFISFLISNWQEILILFKSKYDIYTTLSIVWIGDKYQVPYLGTFIVPPFLAHFVMPFIYGTVASIVMPYITMRISKLTGRNYAQIRHIDREFDSKEQARLDELQKEIEQKKDERLSLEKKIEDQRKSLAKIEGEKKEVEDARISLFYGIKAIVDIYETKGESISTQEDFVDLLKAVEQTDFYKDTGLYGINKLVDDVKRIYEHQSILNDK